MTFFDAITKLTTITTKPLEEIPKSSDKLKEARESASSSQPSHEKADVYQHGSVSDDFRCLLARDYTRGSHAPSLKGSQYTPPSKPKAGEVETASYTSQAGGTVTITRNNWLGSTVYQYQLAHADSPDITGKTMPNQYTNETIDNACTARNLNLVSSAQPISSAQPVWESQPANIDRVVRDPVLVPQIPEGSLVAGK